MSLHNHTWEDSGNHYCLIHDVPEKMCVSDGCYCYKRDCCDSCVFQRVNINGRMEIISTGGYHSTSFWLYDFLRDDKPVIVHYKKLDKRAFGFLWHFAWKLIHGKKYNVIEVLE